MGAELQPLVKSLSFCDIDEPANRMEQFRWNMVHRQIEGGTFHGKLMVAQVAGMQFAQVTYDRGIRSWGDSPVGMITIAVALSVPQSLSWHGHSLAMNHAILQKSNRGIDFLRRGSFPLALASVDINSLLHAAHATNQPQIEPLILGNAVVVQPDEVALSQFRHYFQNLFILIQKHPRQALQPETQTLIRQETIPLMLNLLTSDQLNQSVPALHPSHRYPLMKLAEAMIMDDLSRPWTVHDLCTALHVSERTLRYGFQEYFGMSPMTYLKIQRLNRVRRQLKIATTEQTTVTDIAIQWGFWHMGQFAKDYKRMFGECPSETLRSAS